MSGSAHPFDVRRPPQFLIRHFAVFDQWQVVHKRCTNGVGPESPIAALTTGVHMVYMYIAIFVGRVFRMKNSPHL